MKFKWLFLVLCIVLLAFVTSTTLAATTLAKTSYDLTSAVDVKFQIYYHWHPANAQDDFTDTDTLVCSKFYGNVLSIRVDASGVDTSYDITIMVDPYEIGETQVHTLYPVKAFTALDAANDYWYAVTIEDETGNIFGGPPVIGDLYIRRANVATTVTDLAIYVDGEIK